MSPVQTLFLVISLHYCYQIKIREGLIYPEGSCGAAVQSRKGVCGHGGVAENSLRLCAHEALLWFISGVCRFFPTAIFLATRGRSICRMLKAYVASWQRLW